MSDNQPVEGTDQPLEQVGGSQFCIPVYLAGAQTAGTNKWRTIMPFNCDLSRVYLHAGTAPTGADLIVDINRDGTTVYTTQANRPKIVAGSSAIAAADVKAPDIADATETTSAGASVGVGTFKAGSVVSIDVDQIGSTVAGSDLSVNLLITRR